MALRAIENIAVGARFLSSLPAFLRRPVNAEEARASLGRRLAERETSFLDLVRRAIYANPDSPYHRLLSLAGCEFGDLERLVRLDGVESALRELLRRGVYLTVNEFKGRQPAVRGSASIAVDPSKLRNPLSAAHVLIQTSGSRGARSPVVLDLASLRIQAGDLLLLFAACGGSDWRHAHWAVPGSSAMGRLLQYGVMRVGPVRWFSQIEPATAGLHPGYRWSARALRWGSALAGRSAPSPEYVPPDRPLPIARWMAEVLRAGRTPHLGSFPSSVVRLCQAADEAGLDLSGAWFTLIGEPVTDARLAAIRQTGARALPLCGSAETGLFGYGCLRPEAADDLHVVSDLHALIQAEGEPAGSSLPPGALLMSSVRPTARMIMLNVSLGDQAALTERSCGCPLEQFGWTRHLHGLRSFEKLNAAGIAILDVDIIRVLERDLPARFGGGPTSYQLVEEETESGRALLRLLVDPALGPLDGEAVADEFLTAVGGGAEPRRLIELQWRQAGLPRVERRPPLVAASGKILHLHQSRRPAPAADRHRAVSTT